MPNSRKHDASASQQLQSSRATASSKANQASPASPANETTEEAISSAKIHELLQKLSEDQNKHFADVRVDVLETRRAVEGIEGKLADMLSRLTSVEARLDMLEEAERQRCDSPPASASEVEKLNAKLTEYEDRERPTHLRFPRKG